MIFRVNAVRTTKLGGNLELFRIHVNANDGGGTTDLRCLNAGKSNRTEAKDCHRRECFHFSGVPDGTKAGGDTAAKEASLLQVHLVWD